MVIVRVDAFTHDRTHSIVPTHCLVTSLPLSARSKSFSKDGYERRLYSLESYLSGFSIFF